MLDLFFMVREGRTGTVELKARDSPEGEQRDRGDWKTHLIFILRLMSIHGVDTLRGRREQIQTQIHICTSSMRFLILSTTGKVDEINSFSQCFINLHACSEMLAEHLKIPLTCDLPNGAEQVEFFWIQRFDIVIDIPVNGNRRSEQQMQKYICYILVFSMVYMLFNQTNGKFWLYIHPSMNSMYIWKFLTLNLMRGSTFLKNIRHQLNK